MKHVSLPIAISMTLIWLSEGERIFGGLSVRGAAEKTNREEKAEHIKFHIFLPRGQWEYDLFIKDHNKGCIKMGTNKRKYNI